MTKTNFQIRRAKLEDAEPLTELVLALMAHLGDSANEFDAARFTDDAFGAEPQFSVLVAAHEAKLVGYVLFHDAYEPSFAARGVYLCDIYVRPAMRRHGVGRALLSAVAKDGNARGRTFVWWVARGDDARMFYRTLADVEQQVTAHAATFAAFERLLA